MKSKFKAMEVEFKERNVIVSSPKIESRIIIRPISQGASLFEVVYESNGETPLEFEGYWTDTNTLLMSVDAYLDRKPVSKRKAVNTRWEQNHAVSSE